MPGECGALHLYGQWADALKATVLALVPLGIVYLVTSYGIVPMVRWASERSVALADSIGSVLRRDLPLLLVSITFLFLAAEAWEVLGQLHRRRCQRAALLVARPASDGGDGGAAPGSPASSPPSPDCPSPCTW
jgi:hypothetical protein